MTSNGVVTSTIAGLKDKVNLIAMSNTDQTMYVSSELFVCALRDGVFSRVDGITAKTRMTASGVNDHSIYVCADDGTIHKINDQAVSGTHVIEGNCAKDVSLDNDTIWVVTPRNTVHEIDANSLTEKRKIDIPYDGCSITAVKNAAEVWVGDKKGKIHVYSLESLEQTSEFQAHPHPVDVLTISPDGNRVASGDHNRQIKVWNATTKEELLQHGLHKNAVLAIQFTADSSAIASAASDNSIVVYNIENKKSSQISMAHGPKTIV